MAFAVPVYRRILNSLPLRRLLMKKILYLYQTLIQKKIHKFWIQMYKRNVSTLKKGMSLCYYVIYLCILLKLINCLIDFMCIGFSELFENLKKIHKFWIQMYKRNVSTLKKGIVIMSCHLFMYFIEIN